MISLRPNQAKTPSRTLGTPRRKKGLSITRPSSTNELRSRHFSSTKNQSRPIKLIIKHKDDSPYNQSYNQTDQRVENASNKNKKHLIDLSIARKLQFDTQLSNMSMTERKLIRNQNESPQQMLSARNMEKTNDAIRFIQLTHK